MANKNICQMPLEVMANDGGACEYLIWRDDTPLCSAPGYTDDCPDFSYYFEGEE